ncbi:MAG: AgmX/PglI C-terminal domain-containing protein [Myxococcota bacterium]
MIAANRTSKVLGFKRLEIIVTLSIGLVGSACDTTKQEFERLCPRIEQLLASDDYRSATHSERLALVQRTLDASLNGERGSNMVFSLQYNDVSSRYEMVRQTAAEVGLNSWQCEALDTAYEPSPLAEFDSLCADFESEFDEDPRPTLNALGNFFSRALRRSIAEGETENPVEAEPSARLALLQATATRRTADWSCESLEIALTPPLGDLPTCENTIRRSAIAESLASTLNAVQGCLNKGLSKNPGLAGRSGKLDLSWISAHGHTYEVKVEHDSYGDAGVAGCIENEFWKARMPATEGCRFEVRYPVVLSTPPPQVQDGSDTDRD